MSLFLSAEGCTNYVAVRSKEIFNDYSEQYSLLCFCPGSGDQVLKCKELDDLYLATRWRTRVGWEVNFLCDGSDFVLLRKKSRGCVFLAR